MEQKEMSHKVSFEVNLEGSMGKKAEHFFVKIRSFFTSPGPKE